MDPVTEERSDGIVRCHPFGTAAQNCIFREGRGVPNIRTHVGDDVQGLEARAVNGVDEHGVRNFVAEARITVGETGCLIGVERSADGAVAARMDLDGVPALVELDDVGVEELEDGWRLE